MISRLLSLFHQYRHRVGDQVEDAVGLVFSVVAVCLRSYRTGRIPGGGLTILPVAPDYVIVTELQADSGQCILDAVE